MRYIYSSLCLVLVGLLIGCNGTPQRDVARLEQGDESGIGGTGILARGSGIGGTGIIGQVTGFGSIFVNGVEVELDKQTSLHLNGQSVNNYSFARGDVVAILAKEYKGKTLARQIYIRHEVIGPVSSVNRHAGTFSVLGQDVAIEKRAVSLPRSGQVVRVSGFRNNRGRILATRVVRTRQHMALLVGAVRKNPGKTLFIGRQQIRLKDSSAIHTGLVVRVQGHIRGNILWVSRLTTLNEPPFAKRVKHLLVQGFVSKQSGQTYKIGSIVFKVRTPNLRKRLSSQAGKHIRLKVRKNPHGAWEAKRIIPSRGLSLGRNHRSMKNLRNRPDMPNIPHRRNEFPGHFMRR